jgi:excisionase family DNA binding protein
MPPRHRLLTAREAIGYLGISLNTLNRIEKRGLIRPFRTPGGHRRYDQSMLDEYLERSRRARGRRRARTAPKEEVGA